MSAQVDLAKLREKAQAATPGPWEALPSHVRWSHFDRPVFREGLWYINPSGNHERVPMVTVDRADDHHEPTRQRAKADAEFIAACSPDVILELCERAAGLHATLCREIRLLAEIMQERDTAREALREIVKCESTFSRDPLEHARDAVAHCRELARAALEKGGAA